MLTVISVIPQSEVPAKFLQETGDKCSENSANIFWRFSSFNFQGKWPREISRKVCDIYHSAPSQVLSLLQLWRWGPDRGGPILSQVMEFLRGGPFVSSVNTTLSQLKSCNPVAQSPNSNKLVRSSRRTDSARIFPHGGTNLSANSWANFRTNIPGQF